MCFIDDMTLTWIYTISAVAVGLTLFLEGTYVDSNEKPKLRTSQGTCGHRGRSTPSAESGRARGCVLLMLKWCKGSELRGEVRV